MKETSKDVMRYDHEVLENTIGDAATWMLINTFCHEDIIEYGTSPRYGWLTDKGRKIAEFVNSHSEDEMYELLMQDDELVP